MPMFEPNSVSRKSTEYFALLAASSDDADASTVVLTGTGDLVLGPPKAAHKQVFRWNQAAFAFQKLD